MPAWCQCSNNNRTENFLSRCRRCSASARCFRVFGCCVWKVFSTFLRHPFFSCVFVFHDRRPKRKELLNPVEDFFFLSRTKLMCKKKKEKRKTRLKIVFESFSRFSSFGGKTFSLAKRKNSIFLRAVVVCVWGTKSRTLQQRRRRVWKIEWKL